MSSTPFIPPLNTPEGSPVLHPVIPGSSSGGSPNMSGWGNMTSTIPGSYPIYSPQHGGSPYIPTSPYVSPGVMPGQSQSRTNSRQQGLSADWTGYPQGTPYVAPNRPLSGGHVPPSSPYGPPPPTGPHPGAPYGIPSSPYGPPPPTGPHPNSPYGIPLHPNSPWYPPSAPAAYPAFTTPWAPPQQFPPTSTPWGAPPRHLPPQTQAYTPWAPQATIPPPGAGPPQGWGAPPPQPYFPPPEPAWGMQYGSGPAHPPTGPRVGGHPEPPGQVSDRIDPFAEGDSYGPVLDPRLIRMVGAQVRINPLIAPIPDEGPETVHLKWNMLYPVSTIQRSTDPSHVSWSKGRDAPATFPRLRELRIISETMPWIIQIRATKDSRGVTCAELIDAIARDLNRNTGKNDYEALPAAAKNEVRAAYKYNRSPLPHVPGGMLGQGMKRLDFLRKNAMFGGIEINERVVRKVFGDLMPGVFVLKCSQNFMTKKDVDEQNKRMEHSRPRSSSKGPRSRAGSTGITIKTPSEEEDEDGDF